MILQHLIWYVTLTSYTSEIISVGLEYNICLFIICLELRYRLSNTTECFVPSGCRCIEELLVLSDTWFCYHCRISNEINQLFVCLFIINKKHWLWSSFVITDLVWISPPSQPRRPSWPAQRQTHLIGQLVAVTFAGSRVKVIKCTAPRIK